jgi:hypothetical protein
MEVMKKLYLVLVLVLNFGLYASKIQYSNLNPSKNGDSIMFVDDALQFIKVKNTNQLSEYDIMLERRLEIKKHYVDYLTMVDAIILSSIDNGAVFEEKNSYFKEFKNEKLIFVASFSDFKLEIVRKWSASDSEINQVVVFFNSFIEKADFKNGYVCNELKTYFDELKSIDHESIRFDNWNATNNAKVVALKDQLYFNNYLFDRIDFVGGAVNFLENFHELKSMPLQITMQEIRKKAKMFHYANQSNVALKYYKMAADSGCADATFEIASMYYTDKKYNNSVYWFKKAAELGNQRAMMTLYKIFIKGIYLPKETNTKHEMIVAPNFKNAYAWLEKAHEKGNLEATFLLAQAHDIGNHVIPKNNNKAIELYESLCTFDQQNVIKSYDASFACKRFYELKSSVEANNF